MGTEGGEGVQWTKEIHLTVFAAPHHLSPDIADRPREQVSRGEEHPLCFLASQSLDGSLFTVMFSTGNLVRLGGWPEEEGIGGPTRKWGRERRKIKKRKPAGTHLLGTGQEGGPGPGKSACLPLCSPLLASFQSV